MAKRGYKQGAMSATDAITQLRDAAAKCDHKWMKAHAASARFFGAREADVKHALKRCGTIKSSLMGAKPRKRGVRGLKGPGVHGLHSRNATVVTYAAREMMKRKSPAAAARATAKKLSGSPNIFIDGGRAAVEIDPKVLEDALWDMLVDSAVEAAAKFRPEKREWAIDGTATLYNQAKAGALAPPKFAAELRRRATARLGVDPFKPE